MWKLYNILPEMGENIFDSLQELSPEILLGAIKILYKKQPKNLMEAFLVGIEKSGFFSFSELMRTFK